MVIVNHDLRVVNGGTLFMPPWEEGQDDAHWGSLDTPSVYTGSLTQKYPTGAIWRNGLRTFIYTLMDATYYGSGGDAVGAGYLSESMGEYVNLSNNVITATAGDTSLIIERSGTTVNQFAGGFLGIKNSTGGFATTGRYAFFQILSNTVADGSTDYVTFELDGALAISYATTADCVVSAHPYALTKHNQTPNEVYGMTTGVFTHTTVASEYCWVQTGGPCNLINPWATFEGAETGCVPVYAIGGTCNTTTSKAASTVASGYEAAAYQCIGWSYPSTDISGTPTNNTVAIAVFLSIFN